MTATAKSNDLKTRTGTLTASEAAANLCQGSGLQHRSPTGIFYPIRVHPRSSAVTLLKKNLSDSD